MMRICLFAVAAVLALPPAAAAQDASPSAPEEAPVSVTFVVENDLFAGTDRHYTNGVRASWMRPEGVMPSYADWMADFIFGRDARATRRIGYAFGQSMFTPENVAARELVRDDRPYAGWLYGEMILTSERPPAERRAGRVDTFVLSLGVVGPLSFAEDAQREWHETFGFRELHGWDNQIRNEPAVNVAYYRSWPYLHWLDIGGWAADVTPHVGGALGNVFTHAALGATFRFGRNLDNDFGGPARIGPSRPGGAYVVSDREFGWYLFAGFEGRAVARNIFLDGNTFSDSHSVDKKTFVGDLQFGIAVMWAGYRLTYTQVFRSKEFDGQDGGDRFGAISLTVPF